MIYYLRLGLSEDLGLLAGLEVGVDDGLEVGVCLDCWVEDGLADGLVLVFCDGVTEGLEFVLVL